jgi:catechol 2,3-dioxygenase-like lactoylglutathione lyase family enzyme
LKLKPWRCATERFTGGTVEIVKIIAQLRTTDLASSIRFYTSQLGFTLEFQYEDFYAGVSAGGNVIHLKLVDDPDPSIAFVRDGEHFDLYLETADLVATAEALQHSVERLAAHVDDFAARESEDREFHLRLAKATGNSSLELVVQGLWDQRAELWGRMQQHFHTRDLAERTIRDHAAIAAAVAARNPEGARAAMHRHLARVAREFQRGVDNEERPGGGRDRRAAPMSARTRKAARP